MIQIDNTTITQIDIGDNSTRKDIHLVNVGDDILFGRFDSIPDNGETIAVTGTTSRQLICNTGVAGFLVDFDRSGASFPERRAYLLFELCCSPSQSMYLLAQFDELAISDTQEVYSRWFVGTPGQTQVGSMSEITHSFTTPTGGNIYIPAGGIKIYDETWGANRAFRGCILPPSASNIVYSNVNMSNSGKLFAAGYPKLYCTVTRAVNPTAYRLRVSKI